MHIWWKTGTLSRVSGLSGLLSLSTFSQGLSSGLSNKVSHSLHDCSGDLGASISEDRKQKLLASWSLGLDPGSGSFLLHLAGHSHQTPPRSREAIHLGSKG